MFCFYSSIEVRNSQSSSCLICTWGRCESKSPRLVWLLFVLSLYFNKFLMIQIIFICLLITISEYLFFVSFRFLTLTSGSCYIHCINVASEMTAGTSILFTGLKFHTENTDSVNELRSCIVLSPCSHRYILGSKDDRRTKYTAIY